MSDVSWVVSVGACELAFGALSGWVIAATLEFPERIRAMGVKAMPRLRQAHIDFIVMGVILVALGLAAPDLPRPWQVLLVIGAIVNPVLFLPLAFDPDAGQRRPYKLAATASFTCMCSGTVAAAVWLL